MALLTIKRLPDKTILKSGRKILGTITENKNQGYHKFILWFEIEGIYLSGGFESEAAAIERAEKVYSDFNIELEKILNKRQP